MSTLAELGITLERVTPGEHRAACPQCARQKRRHGDDALAVRLEPDGTGAFYCHRCGWKGSLRPSGVSAGNPPARLRAAAVGTSAADARAEHNRERAQRTWRETTDLCACAGDGLAWRYLVERRGIHRWDPDRLRWHPACPWERGTAGCIVVPVNDAATGRVVGIWRIRPALEGKVERKGLGPTKGNAARLFRAPGPRLVITEGVEDALAAHEMTGLPAWAALSAGNMAALILPDRFREVLILADKDESGVGQANAHALAARLRAEGRHAEVRRPTVGKDANDVLLGREAG